MGTRVKQSNGNGAWRRLNANRRTDRPWLISRDGKGWEFAYGLSREAVIAEALHEFALGVGDVFAIGRLEWDEYETFRCGEEPVNPSEVETVVLRSPIQA